MTRTRHGIGQLGEASHHRSQFVGIQRGHPSAHILQFSSDGLGALE